MLSIFTLSRQSNSSVRVLLTFLHFLTSAAFLFVSLPVRANVGDSQLPAGYFEIFPAPVNSKMGAAFLHSSGELIYFVDMPLSRQGKFGAAKGVVLLHQSSDVPVTVRWVAKGRKLQVKTADGSMIAQTVDPKSGMITISSRFVKSKTQRVRNIAAVPIAQIDPYYWETVGDLLNIAVTLNAGGPFDAYGELSRNNPLGRKSHSNILSSSSAGSLNLISTQRADFAQGLYVISKMVGVAMAAVAIGAGSTLITAGSVTAGGVVAVLGAAAFTAGFFDVIALTRPRDQIDTASGVFSILSIMNEASSNYPNIRAAMEMGQSWWRGITRGSVAGALQGLLLDSYLERQSHKLARGLSLAVLYTWPTSQRDLDTSTHFLGQRVGYACGSSTEHMLWTGDNTTNGGREFVEVLISKAAEEDILSATFSVLAHAGWYTPAGGSGPATLGMYLYNPKSGALYGPNTEKTIQPGSQTGCANTFVGRADFTWDRLSKTISWSIY